MGTKHIFVVTPPQLLTLFRFAPQSSDWLLHAKQCGSNMCTCAIDCAHIIQDRTLVNRARRIFNMFFMRTSARFKITQWNSLGMCLQTLSLLALFMLPLWEIKKCWRPYNKKDSPHIWPQHVDHGNIQGRTYQKESWGTKIFQKKKKGLVSILRHATLGSLSTLQVKVSLWCHHVYNIGPIVLLNMIPSQVSLLCVLR